MKNSSEIYYRLPSINKYSKKILSGSITYIGVAGFEDRAFAFLDRFIAENMQIEKAIGITYLPYDSRNRKKEFKEKVLKIAQSVSWVTFNRHDPQLFQNAIKNLSRSISSKSVIIDISGMSKLLIMVLLQFFRDYGEELIIAYADAETYHPTPAEFEKAKNKIIGPPDFLTSDVFRILHVTSLSSSSMQGYPILLIAYPTFNHNEIVALQTELSPNCTVMIFGLPLKEENKWRLGAVKEINDKVVDPDYCRETPVLSTFDYIANLEGLQKIYQTYQYTHKILLSPTGSKLQTIAAFIFKQIHPDVQIVYPSTKSFIGEYTEGYSDLWVITMPHFSELVSYLDKYRRVH